LHNQSSHIPLYWIKNTDISSSVGVRGGLIFNYNMKKLIVILMILMGVMQNIVHGQELPSKPSSGFAFPLGSKFTIKLIPTDSIHFDFSVIAFEPYTTTLDTWEHENLFPKAGQDSTISFCFCIATEGKTDAEKEKNRKILLLMKNYTSISFEYKSDIQRTENGVFTSTSNVGIFAGAGGTEMWPDMIYAIGLRDFKRYQFDKHK